MPPLDPLEFLKLAEELAVAGGDARLRTAVGRAYYALFLFAREKTGAYPTTEEERKRAHGLVLRALRKRRLWTTASQLGKLMDLRHTADYQMVPEDPTELDWTRNWNRAQSLVNVILPELRKLK